MCMGISPKELGEGCVEVFKFVHVENAVKRILGKHLWVKYKYC